MHVYEQQWQYYNVHNGDIAGKIGAHVSQAGLPKSGQPRIRDESGSQGFGSYNFSASARDSV